MNQGTAGRPRLTQASLITLAALLAASPGCGGRRTRPARPPMAEGTTIGRDLRAAPAGSVLPAVSLGVDMVDGSPDHPAARDERIEPVGHSMDGATPGMDD